jgi:hypothetical protein
MPNASFGLDFVVSAFPDLPDLPVVSRSLLSNVTWQPVEVRVGCVCRDALLALTRQGSSHSVYLQYISRINIS